MKKESKRLLILIEGNPYTTEHKIEERAIRGAIISILTAWQIPIISTKNAEGTSELLILLGTQSLKSNNYIRSRFGTKSKKIKTQSLFFLQGIPSVGPTTTGRLIERLGNIKAIVNASEDELKNVKGIGKKNAKSIVDFFMGK